MNSWPPSPAATPPRRAPRRNVTSPRQARHWLVSSRRRPAADLSEVGAPPGLRGGPLPGRATSADPHDRRAVADLRTESRRGQVAGVVAVHLRLHGLDEAFPGEVRAGPAQRFERALQD